MSTAGVFAQSDAILFARVQAGDEKVMGLLYDLYSSVVYSIALAVVNSTDNAEDVLHETFMQLWREPTSFALRDGSLKASLATSTFRRAVQVRDKYQAAAFTASKNKEETL